MKYFKVTIDGKTITTHVTFKDAIEMYSTLCNNRFGKWDSILELGGMETRFSNFDGKTEIVKLEKVTY